MYAKLVFPYSTTPMQRNRDIARIIHESSSGSASLSNLEFIDQINSEFFAGVNSGWSLASGSIPAKGTDLDTSVDNNFTLQSPCVDTNKVKYANITINGNNTNAGLLGNNSVTSVIQPIIDYGTGTEALIGGYSSTNAIFYEHYGFGYQNDIVYIFATPRKLIIGGRDSIGVALYMHLEFAETGQTQFYDLVPQAYMCYRLNGSSSDKGSNNPYYGGTRYTASGTVPTFITFLKSIYSPEHNGIVRVLYGGCNLNDQAFDGYMYLENGTVNGTGMDAPGPENEIRWVPSMLFPPWNRYSSDPTTGGRIGQQRKSGGGITYPLFPLYTSIDRWNTGIISFKDCNVYSSVTDIGITGDEIIIGNNTYVVFAEDQKTSTLILKE